MEAVGEEGKSRPERFSEEVMELRRTTHKAIDGVSADIEGLRHNKAVARIHGLVNALGQAPDGAGAGWAKYEAVDALVRLIAPMMPHLAEELWQSIGGEGLVVDAPWPEADPALLLEDMVTLAVQVSGKLRDTLLMPAGSGSGVVEEAALSSAKVQRAIAGKEVRKVIVVPDRIVNIVVSG